VRTIKKDYSIQLKIYAQLYADKYGAYPNRLAIVDLANQAFDIPFSSSECQQIKAQSINELMEINILLEAGRLKDLQSVGDQCGSCLYRPNCPAHIEQLRLSNGVLSLNDKINRFDICGVLSSFERMDNGSYVYKIQTPSFMLSVHQIPEPNLSALISLSGQTPPQYFEFSEEKRLSFFNIKRKTEKTFDFTNFSRMYVA
jgi:hypothetical protein